MIKCLIIRRMKLVLQETRFSNCLLIVNSFLYPDEDKSNINFILALKLSNEQVLTVEKYLSYSIF
jgi:hypothetical protein